MLDNGVRSNEMWRILDCADDLSWAGNSKFSVSSYKIIRIAKYVLLLMIVFYYSGAASVAGTSYQGSLIVTPDGR